MLSPKRICLAAVVITIALPTLVLAATPYGAAKLNQACSQVDAVLLNTGD